ncbi:MAG: Gfo/Idh/MocA family oxidoreductase [Caldilineaceae bacterium]|nr:Gfo/Idh/MocA family oxidoreductase [Caldilineaceae bacterium]
MTDQPIRVGIAGLGRSGWDIHARLLEPLAEQFQIVAVLDADSNRRAEAIDRFDCQAYTEYDDLLADPAVELMVVALPSFLHADASIAALKSGKHVVCEKPMATSLGEQTAWSRPATPRTRSSPSSNSGATTQILCKCAR